MRRILALILVLCVGAFWFPPARAEKCTFCSKEIEKGINPLKCPHCIQKANAIRRVNKKVWVLGFKQGKLRHLQLKDDTRTPENYWYLPYTLTNRDKVDHQYFIEIRAYSDRGKRKYPYTDTHIEDVYQEIRKRLNVGEKGQLLTKRDVSMPPPGKKNKLPRQDNKPPADLLKETAKIALPTIKAGETLKCVAIFRPIHREMDRLVITIRGLTNSSLLKPDAYVKPKGKPHRRVVKEAVLELHYSRPGDEFAHSQDPIRFVKRKWTDVTRVLKSDLE